jgi:hypothetical protein
VNLDRIRQLATELVNELHSPTGPEVSATDPDAPFGRNLAGEPREAPGWWACTSMREAAEREGAANFIALVGGGIKPGAAQLYQDFRPDWMLIERTIDALGRSPWGQDWLRDPENRAVTDPAYCRRFGVRPVERKPDGTLHEYE